MTQPDEPPVTARNSGKHWLWFVGLLTAMGLLGFVAAAVLMLPLAMATDPCHEGVTDKVCQLSAKGQNVLVWIPWMALVAGTVLAVAGAVVAEWRKRTPLIGIPVGMLGYFATIPIGYWLAFAV
ncbi:hypothetical protein ACT17_31430 [Mycolicibacterium conceptionense]|jgi:hypothetical protein|uniref:Transmembrane protein n=2 Tax=Mycolicibacterium TaxID=1866885 RepID=A0A0J8TYL9_9MYCO|nr:MULTISPECIES: hypothetical protein [Mycolicibacterium]KLI05568.1 hypothetical protein AA982_23735 [Mycolicibacterium senegalense]KLO51922.1 hypothetical protein ABW05_10690 [Mycolicibacterium senegalense]KMV14207.1 hypothetical protein ACT17_31430 [Mycolicibacterium conceptionense]ORV21068.1 hypothetical protein AWB98_01910 [Mycolicibacterium conceptionense]CQD07827.1 hypothetical protein BN970_01505 [Mycolicibacterium conceptionense]